MLVSRGRFLKRSLPLSFHESAGGCASQGKLCRLAVAGRHQLRYGYGLTAGRGVKGLSFSR